MRRASRLSVLLLLLSVAASGCGSSKTIGEDAVYVALGDSYTAGPGIAPISDQRCNRSELNYPALVARDLNVAEFHDRSCSSATTLDLEQPQTFRSVHVNDPQLDVVDDDTTLVTMGLGLNNLRISTGLILVCLTPEGTEPTDSCEKYLRVPEATIRAQLEAAAAQVEASIETIRKKAPEARVVLVGYPRLAPDQGSCPDRLPAPEAMVDRLRDAMKFANRAWREAAHRAGASYVDMYTPSKGHDICSEHPWISDWKGVPGKSFRLHPFAAYEKAVATRIVSMLTD